MWSAALAELGGRKANLVTDMQSLGQVKLKKSRNVQACSLFSLSSLFSERERKNLIPLFFLFKATGSQWPSQEPALCWLSSVPWLTFPFLHSCSLGVTYQIKPPHTCLPLRLYFGKAPG